MAAAAARLTPRSRQLRGSHTVAGRQEAAKLDREPIPPPPFNALLIAETGSGLGELATLMPYYDVNPGPVLVLGPGLWAADPGAVARRRLQRRAVRGARSGRRDALHVELQRGLWRAALALAAIAFDAGALARVTTQSGRIDQAALTNPSGFSGADGGLASQPDGSVQTRPRRLPGGRRRGADHSARADILSASGS